MSITATEDAVFDPIEADAIGPESLSGMSFADLAEMFRRLAHPDKRPAGDLRGRCVSLVGIERLPRAARTPIVAALARATALVWRGKRFEEDRGTNLWLSGRAPIAFARFVVGQDEAGSERGALRFDYELPTNPRLARPITAELRVLAPGLYLGRMDYVPRGRRHTVLYFTLEH
jgi:hypothetical protein